MGKNDFVREQIKDKPMNKKKSIHKLLFSGICGIIFGLCAGLVLLLFQVFFVQEPQQGTTVKETQITQQTEEPLQSEMPEETETQSETTEPEIPTVEEWFTLENYQTILNEIYAIGTQANRSIVTVYSLTSDTDWFNNSYETEGQSAGVIIGEDDNYLLVLTERKTIKKAKSINVGFSDGTIASASLRVYDGNTGLEVLEIPKSEIDSKTLRTIRVIEYANSNMVTDGNIVIALGRPLGSTYSILSGNITSTMNEVSTEDHNFKVFTTDIVASKNASGILVNTKGQLVGIVMQDFSVEDAQNTLTAVAVSDLKLIIDMLCKGQQIPYLGVSCSTVTSEIANNYDLPRGVYIKNVTMDSPAMLAGIQSGDILVSVNGETMDSASELSAVILSLHIEENCRIVVKRQSGDRYVEITCDVTPGVLK